jgi:hypothetical protein
MSSVIVRAENCWNRFPLARLFKERAACPNPLKAPRAVCNVQRPRGPQPEAFIFTPADRISLSKSYLVGIVLLR